MPKSERFRTWCQSYDARMQNRLRVQYVALPDHVRAYDFDSLIWEAWSDYRWNRVVVWTRDELQGSSSCRRWAAGIAQFDADRGRAVVMLGELDEQVQDRAEYSWWNCDIQNKTRIGELQKCESPSDRFQIGSFSKDLCTSAHESLIVGLCPWCGKTIIPSPPPPVW